MQVELLECGGHIREDMCAASVLKAKESYCSTHEQLTVFQKMLEGTAELHTRYLILLLSKKRVYRCQFLTSCYIQHIDIGKTYSGK